MRRTLIIGGLVLLAFCVVIVFLTPRSINGSIYSSAPDGTRALSLLLQRLNVPFKALREPSGTLKRNVQVVIAIAPGERFELRPVLEWVEEGGVAILAPTAAQHQEIQESLGARFPRGFAALTTDSLIRASAATAPVQCPLDLVERCRGVRSISRAETSFAVTEKFEVLVGTPEAAQVARSRLKEGELYLFASPKLFTNEFIDRADNVRLIYQLLERRGKVLFEEFSHGYLEEASVERQTQLLTFKVLLGAIAILLLLAALSRAVRFGAPRYGVFEGVPVSAEFVDAVGLLYREHGAASVLRRYVAAWRERMVRRFGVRSAADSRAFVKSLFEVGALSDSACKEVEEAIRQLEEAHDGSLSDSAASRAVRTLERVLIPHSIGDRI